MFSAEVSAADAVLFMLTTSLSQDLYKRFINPAATDAQVLRVARVTAVVAGSARRAVALACRRSDRSTRSAIFYTLWASSLFVPVVAGLYSAARGTPEALAAIAGGIATVVAAAVLERRPVDWHLHAGDGSASPPP